MGILHGYNSAGSEKIMAKYQSLDVGKRGNFRLDLPELPQAGVAVAADNELITGKRSRSAETLSFLALHKRGVAGLCLLAAPRRVLCAQGMPFTHMRNQTS